MKKTSTPDLPTLDTALATLKERKNYLLGVGAVAIALVVVVLFVRNSLSESALAPWRTMLAEQPWNTSEERAEELAAELKGSDAGPMASYWEAVRSFQAEKKPGQAVEILQESKAAFGSDYLWTVASVPDPKAPDQLVTAGDLALRQLQEFSAWSVKNPAPTENLPPPPGNTITFVTSQGEIVIGLYGDRAPLTCAEFVKIAPTLKGSFIARVQEDQWVNLGQDDQGVEGVVVESDDDTFPPYEENSLYHFEGSVTLQQPPFSVPPFRGNLKLWLEVDFQEAGRSVVFATVTKGLNLLKTISAGERSTTNPGLLAAPIEITDVRMDLTTLAPPEDADNSAEENADGDSSDPNEDEESGGESEGDGS